MNQALMAMLQAFESQITFATQLAADVAALKVVVCSLDARARPRLEEQVAIMHGKFQQELDLRLRDFETLRQIISQLPTPKPN